MCDKCTKCGVVGKHIESAHHEIRTISELVDLVNKDNVEVLAKDMMRFLFYISHLKQTGNMESISDHGRFGWVDDGQNDFIMHDGKGNHIDINKG